MRDYRKFCRPKTIKNPLSGDYEVTLNCGSTVYVEKDEFEKKTNKYFRNYKKYEEPIPNNVIRYTANLKLAEINSGYNGGGIDTRLFDVSIVNHTFENGVGTIEFSGDILIIKNGSSGPPMGAFYNCTDLTSVEFPLSVTSIGSYTFRNCTGLTSITIPNSVTNITGNIFLQDTPWYNNQPDELVYAGKVAYKYKGTMSEGTSITLEDGTLGIAASAFADCSGLTSVTIPNSVMSIGNSAFYGCSSLTSVTIPSSVTSIGIQIFYRCSGLTSITIPNSVTSIGSSAFLGCSGLTTVNIPNSVTRIEDHAFSGCNGLTSITIPENVTSVGGAMCLNCANLEEATLLSTTPPSVTSSYYGALFENTSENLVIYVPAESVDTYKAASEWSTYADKIKGFDLEYYNQTGDIISPALPWAAGTQGTIMLNEPISKDDLLNGILTFVNGDGLLYQPESDDGYVNYTDANGDVVISIAINDEGTTKIVDANLTQDADVQRVVVGVATGYVEGISAITENMLELEVGESGYLCTSSYALTEDVGSYTLLTLDGTHAIPCKCIANVDGSKLFELINKETPFEITNLLKLSKAVPTGAAAQAPKLLCELYNNNNNAYIRVLHAPADPAADGATAVSLWKSQDQRAYWGDHVTLLLFY